MINMIFQETFYACIKLQPRFWTQHSGLFPTLQLGMFATWSWCLNGIAVINFQWLGWFSLSLSFFLYIMYTYILYIVWTYYVHTRAQLCPLRCIAVLPSCGCFSLGVLVTMSTNQHLHSRDCSQYPSQRQHKDHIVKWLAYFCWSSLPPCTAWMVIIMCKLCYIIIEPYRAIAKIARLTDSWAFWSTSSARFRLPAEKDHFGYLRHRNVMVPKCCSPACPILIASLCPGGASRCSHIFSDLRLCCVISQIDSQNDRVANLLLQVHLAFRYPQRYDEYDSMSNILSTWWAFVQHLERPCDSIFAWLEKELSSNTSGLIVLILSSQIVRLVAWTCIHRALSSCLEFSLRSLFHNLLRFSCFKWFPIVAMLHCTTLVLHCCIANFPDLSSNKMGLSGQTVEVYGGLFGLRAVLGGRWQGHLGGAAFVCFPLFSSRAVCARYVSPRDKRNVAPSFQCFDPCVFRLGRQTLNHSRAMIWEG